MAKVKISEFSSTPGNNTDIDGINLAEGCAPSGINDAIRELMAQLKDFQTGAVGDSFNGPIGSTTPSAGAFTTLSASGAFTYGGVTLSNAVTGTGNMVLSNSPTLVTPALGTPSALVGTNITGTAAGLSIGGNAATATTSTNVSGGTASVTTLSASGAVTLSGGTANGVAYLNGSKVLTTGSALTYNGSNLLSLTSGAIRLTDAFELGWGTNSVFLTGSSTSNVMQFITNGSEQMRLTSTGLGIGTSSPLLTAAGRGNVTINGSSDSIVAFGNNGSTSAYIYSSSAKLEFDAAGTRWIQWNTNGSEQMRLTSTGLGIGTSSPASQLDVSKTGDAIVSLTSAGVQRYQLIARSSGNFEVYDQSSAASRLTLTQSGNLGLGVTPSAWGSDRKILQLGGATYTYFAGNGIANILSNNVYVDSGGTSRYLQSYAAGIYQQNGNGDHYWYTAPSGTAGNAISFTQAATLTAAGDWLVGTTSTIAGARMSVVGDVADTVIRFRNDNTSSPGGLDVHYAGAAPNGSGNYFFLARDTAANRFYVQSNGGIANYQGNDTNLSDRREKTNFAPAKSYLDTICAIPVQTFNYIDQNLEEDPGLTLGVVAQDVQAVAPELVMESNWGTEENPKMRLSIYQTDLQYALMKCIQELNAKVEALEARLASDGPSN